MKYLIKYILLVLMFNCCTNLLHAQNCQTFSWGKKGWRATNAKITTKNNGNSCQSSGRYLYSKDEEGVSAIYNDKNFSGDVSNQCLCFDYNVIQDGLHGANDVRPSFTVYTGTYFAKGIAATFHFNTVFTENSGCQNICLPFHVRENCFIIDYPYGSWEIVKNSNPGLPNDVDDWNTLISNLGGISTYVDVLQSSNQNEEIGLDNFCFENCELPRQVQGVDFTPYGCLNNLSCPASGISLQAFPPGGGSGNQSYQWTSNVQSNQQNSFAVWVCEAGNYGVEITDPGCNVEGVFYIPDIDYDIFVAGSGFVCVNGMPTGGYSLNGSENLEDDPDVWPLSYQWTANNAYISASEQSQSAIWISPSDIVSYPATFEVVTKTNLGGEVCGFYTIYDPNCNNNNFKVIDNNEIESTDNSSSLNLNNFPNPFASETIIEFKIEEETNVRLFVSDISGKQVALILDNQQINSGKYQVVFNGSTLNSGIYFYTIETDHYTVSKRMVLSK